MSKIQPLVQVAPYSLANSEEIKDLRKLRSREEWHMRAYKHLGVLTDLH